MVTTRSADKRLDASREEDLVLRSRRIGSPRSTASTPSQASKRTASTAGNTSSPRTKRSRSGLDNHAHDGAFHVVVNVPIKSTRLQSKEEPVESNEHLQPTGESITKSHDGGVMEHTSMHATPKSVAVNNAATPPDRNNEAFKTPATSRHKRFDSEELDEDTIHVSPAIHTTTTQGYQTAEEEIHDSEDDAPEIETTRAAPAMPHRRSGRSSRVKKSSQHVVGNVDGEADATELVSKQIESNPTTPENVTIIPITEYDEPQIESTNLAASIDPHTSIVEPQVPSIEAVSQSLVGSKHGVLPDTGTVTIEPTNTTPSETLSGTDATTVTADDKMNTIESWRSFGQDVPSSIGNLLSQSTLKEDRGLSLPIRDPSAHTLFLSNSIPGRQAELTPATTSARLPLKATSSLSSYRREKLHQKARGSAGAFRMQNDWSKKRSSFVVS